MATSASPAPREPASGRDALGVAAIAFLVLLVGLRGALHDPPYWDALLGVFPQAVWQFRNGLDPVRLLAEQPGYAEGGACVYPFSAIPALVALLHRTVSEPSARLAILHLASLACAAAAAAAVFRLARPAGRAVAGLAAAAFLAQPGVLALAAQINLEMPLVAAGAWTVVGLAERRFALAFVAALAALLVKPTGVAAAAAACAFLLARLLAPRCAGQPGPRERAWLAAHALLVGLFVAELVLLYAAGRAPPGAGPFAGLAPLVAKRLWTVPEFPLALALLLILAAWSARRGAQLSAPIAAHVLAPALFLLAYLGLLAQWENVLPRYFVAAYPAVLALLAAGCTVRAPRGLAPAVLGGALVLGLVNVRGALHPDRAGAFGEPASGTPLAANDGWLLERSLRFRDGLELDRRIARFAAGRPDAAFVAPWPLQHALVEPAFGYVDRPLDVACAEVAVDWADPAPPTIAELAGAGRELLWILTPNDFTGSASAPRPGDELVASFQVGAQRAFVVRRERFP
ncbi:MAG: hypothetical protein JNK02_14260 [Planctomycetes bacterium]|nr:hypothetical protein [Planctomycetota bacterium]